MQESLQVKTPGFFVVFYILEFSHFSHWFLLIIFLPRLLLANPLLKTQKMSGVKVVVLGCNGLVGARLCRLLQQKETISVSVSSPPLCSHVQIK